MKKYLLLLFLGCALSACRNSEKDSPPENEIEMESDRNPADTSSRTSEGKILEEVATEQDGMSTEIKNEQPKIQESQTSTGISGKYRRVDSETSGCNCSCIEVSFTSATELCIEMDTIYISARFSKDGNRKANLFLVQMLRAENTERELPWKDFDKNTPIATVALQPDGSLKLDWLGFSVNGEIAVDYALFGKKSLEGHYRKY